jgi:GNAT superfamily N-acetyltransferase
MIQDEYHVEPIQEHHLDSVASMCWENRDTQLRILGKQGILGFGAWDSQNISVGSLHCYKVALPDWDDTNFPGYGRARLQDWPLGWPLLAARDKALEFDGPVWGHACFHVGILPNSWQADPAYFNKGIGTALLEASVLWARMHKYPGIIAHGGSRIIPAYNTMMGCMPWTSYERLGFETAAIEEDGKKLPWWVETKGDEISNQVKEALSAGRTLDEIGARLMVLHLN